jgi:hypothetical protein
MMYAATARELYPIEAEQKRAAHLQAFKKKLRKRMLTTPKKPPSRSILDRNAPGPPKADHHKSLKN